MTALSLVGPSNGLRFGKADCERTINYMPVMIESGQGKGGAVAYLKQIPGLRLLAGLGDEIRGLFVARNGLYAVAGNGIFEVTSSFISTRRGSMFSASGSVGMAQNNTQLAVVDGAGLYVLDLDSLTLTTNPANWRGSVVVDTLDGYGLFAATDSNQFYVSANQDFTTFDALDFASAEGSSGNIASLIVKHREAVFLKTKTGEVWYDAGGADFPLSRNDGANIEIGCAAPHTLVKKGGVAFWLGRDESGSAAVFQMAAYQPQRISSHALEELLEAAGDLSGATAFAYSQEGLSFYVLQVPGLQTTWVYEVTTGAWHERAELVNGQYQPWRATSYAYVYGMHIVGDAQGNLYELDVSKNTNNGETLVRDRITPHMALQTLKRVRIGSIQIDCEVGAGLPSGFSPKLMLRYSDDGGKTWGSWRYLTLGVVGQYKARARATMLGCTRDRVWHIRCTDDVACNVLSAVVDEV